MDLGAHILYALNRTRWMTENALEAFQSQEDFLYQPHPTANHALWVIGHLGLADNRFASQFRPEVNEKPDGWDPLFWAGSKLQGADAYPPHEEVVAYFRERRGVLLNVLKELTPEELATPAPPLEAKSPIAGAPCIGYLLLFASQHEWLHLGQMLVARRGLGKGPIVS